MVRGAAAGALRGDRQPDDKYPEEWESRLLTDGDTAHEGDWCERCSACPVAVSAVGAMLFTGGSVSSRMSAHAEAIRMLDGLAERPPTKHES
ncbi:hypothetical protein [Streptomyces lavendulocolor]|uniref:hypothetical protein n=1 Tax=Streptomyces lavendulocolor TaxID=67316 RepID=UPI003C2F84EE